MAISATWLPHPNGRRPRTIVVVVGILAALVLSGSPAWATPPSMPFNGSGTGLDASASKQIDGLHIIADATGQGTDLGRFSEVLDYVLSYDLVNFAGTATITAADRSEVFLVFQGAVPGFASQRFPLPYHSTFTVTGGTGRFAEASGAGTLNGTDYGQGAFNFEFIGNLTRNS